MYLDIIQNGHYIHRMSLWDHTSGRVLNQRLNFPTIEMSKVDYSWEHTQ